MHVLAADKKSLRTQTLKAREKLRPDDAKSASLEIAKYIMETIPASAKVVAGYSAVRGEVELFEAMAQLSERGHTLCLPVVEAPRLPLFFRRWRINHPLEMGQFGIPIPPASEPNLLPDAVIVPLAAFDKNGHRLGYGAGYYDATIRQLHAAGKRPMVIGVGFALQEVEEIPPEPHDEKLDAIVTEKGVIHIA